MCFHLTVMFRLAGAEHASSVECVCVLSNSLINNCLAPGVGEKVP